MQRTPVESSMLRSVGYDPTTAVLELELNNGRIYRYGEVDQETWRGLMAATSKGRYFRDHIDDLFPDLRVSPPLRQTRRRT